ncbi:hypothetical protein ACNKHW_12205 [Shigella flexneri]
MCDLLNVVNSPFSSSDESGGELPFWQQQAFYRLVAGGRLLVAGTAGGVAAVAESGTPAVNTSRRGDESCTATGAGP